MHCYFHQLLPSCANTQCVKGSSSSSPRSWECTRWISWKRKSWNRQFLGPEAARTGPTAVKSSSRDVGSSSVAGQKEGQEEGEEQRQEKEEGQEKEEEKEEAPWQHPRYTARVGVHVERRAYCCEEVVLLIFILRFLFRILEQEAEGRGGTRVQQGILGIPWMPSPSCVINACAAGAPAIPDANCRGSGKSCFGWQKCLLLVLLQARQKQAALAELEQMKA